MTSSDLFRSLLTNDLKHEINPNKGAKTKNFAEIVKAECKWEKPEYKSNIQKTAPEFTTEINSRNLVVGYNGVLHCAVKGNPTPKISWFKNQLSILPKIGPKYRSCNQHGLIQLEVLRAKGRFLSFSDLTIIKWGASSLWSSTLYCLMRKSDQMTIVKTHPTLHTSLDKILFIFF